MPDFTTTAAAVASTPDVRVFGDPDVWTLICKASSSSGGWAKSTKAMCLPHGYVVQVTTEHRGSNGAVVACAEAVTYVPGEWPNMWPTPKAQ